MLMSDVPAIVPQLNDLDVTRWLTVVPYPYTAEDAEWFINENLEGRAKSWSIFAEDVLVGNIGIEGTIGYWIGQNHWGKGYASEAAFAARDHYFQSSDAEALHSEYFLGNAGSKAVLTKIGLQPTTIQTAQIKALGTTTQAQQMVLTRSRWNSLKDA